MKLANRSVSKTSTKITKTPATPVVHTGLSPLSRTLTSNSVRSRLCHANLSATGSVWRLQIRLVFIRDMDETLIIFQSLVSGSYMNTRRMNAEKKALGKKLGMQMMKLILWPLDNAMFFEEIEQVDKHHVRCLDKFDDQLDVKKYDFGNDRFQVYDGRGGRPACDLRKLSYRYRRIREIYNQVPLAALPARREMKANCLPFD